MKSNRYIRLKATRNWAVQNGLADLDIAYMSPKESTDLSCERKRDPDLKIGTFLDFNRCEFLAPTSMPPVDE